MRDCRPQMSRDRFFFSLAGRWLYHGDSDIWARGCRRVVHRMLDDRCSSLRWVYVDENSNVYQFYMSCATRLITQNMHIGIIATPGPHVAVGYRLCRVVGGLHYLGLPIWQRHLYAGWRTATRLLREQGSQIVVFECGPRSKFGRSNNDTERSQPSMEWKCHVWPLPNLQSRDRHSFWKGKNLSNALIHRHPYQR